MDNGLKPVMDNIVESFGSMGASLGISKVVAQLYGLLYMSNEPISLDDMCEFLKISKGNASMNIRYLEQWDAVKKIWIKGSRKDYYEVNPDIKKIIVNRLKTGLNRRLEDFMKNIDEMEKSLNNPRNNMVDRKRVEDIRKRISKIRDLNNLVKRTFLLAGKII